MRAAICTGSDDSDYLAQLLDQFQKEYHFTIRAERFNSGSALLGSGERYEVVLLDSVLSDCLETGAQLRKHNICDKIILLAQDNRAALLGYAIHPDGFLLKPVGYRSLRHVMELCRSCWQGEAQALEITVNRVGVRILCGDIHYIEAQGRMFTVHGRYGQVESRLTGTQLMERLGSASFILCHRSYLVNLFQIREWRRNCLVMENGDQIPISADRWEQLMEQRERFDRENPVRCGEMIFASDNS